MPNWARLWIICGMPSLGPWTEWYAMNRQPTRLPIRIAAMAHGRLRPKTTVASRPVATAVIWALLANQIVNSVFGLPWRSLSGMYSMARCSTISLRPECAPILPGEHGARGA